MARTVALDVLARLRAVLEPVYFAHVPLDAAGAPPAQRYAVIYPSPSRRTWEDLGATPNRAYAVWQVTSVGESGEQAVDVAERVADTLTGVFLTVDGWLTAPVQNDSTTPVRRDDDLPGPPLFYVTVTYSTYLTRNEDTP